MLKFSARKNGNQVSSITPQEKKKKNHVTNLLCLESTFIISQFNEYLLSAFYVPALGYNNKEEIHSLTSKS